MQPVTRPETPPEILSHPAFARMRAAYLAFLRLPENRRAQTRQPDRRLPDLPGLLSAVAAPFGGRCAFCGIEHAQEVYRFRPPRYALPEEEREETVTVWRRVRMPGVSRFSQRGLIDAENAVPEQVTRVVPVPNPQHYGWLADAWQNLYPICADCKPARPENFPVIGARAPVPSAEDYAPYADANTGLWPAPVPETPLLVDPCAVDPAAHLSLQADGRLVGVTDGGAFTIRFFDLNRPKLVTERAKAGARAATRARAAPARIRRRRVWALDAIEIENFKAIERLEIAMPPPPDIPAGYGRRAPALLILGENAAGKSTVLEAVALTMMSQAARRSLRPWLAPLLLDPRYMGRPDLAVRPEGRVTLHFAAGEETARIGLHLTADGMTADRGPRDLPQVFAYGAYRHFLNGLRGNGPERGVVSLFRSDSLLSNPRDWLRELPEARFRQVVAALRFVFGVDFEIITREGGDCRVVTRIGDTFQETPIMHVSSGFRTVLALVCDVLRGLIEAPATRDLPVVEMPAVILIDEVEAHLHPRWKMGIVDGLRQALPAATFIVTTHDPLCLRRARPREVRVMQRQPSEGRSELTVTLEALDRLPEMGALTVDQLLTAEFFGLGDTEDPDTVRALRDLAAQLAEGRADPAGMDVARRIQARLLNDLPIGRTEAERIVQEALAIYLAERRQTRPGWRAATRARIVDLLRRP